MAERITEVTADNLDLIEEQARERSAASRAAAAAMQELRAVGRSDKGVVTVTLDSAAMVLDIEFSVGAASSPSSLGAAVKQAHDRAVVRWQQLVDEVATTHLGEQPDVARLMRESAARSVPDHVVVDEADRS